MAVYRCLAVTLVLCGLCLTSSCMFVDEWDEDHRRPVDIMVDMINRFGLQLLRVHNVNNDNNIALSPYGAASVLTALLEGAGRRTSVEIQRCAGFPRYKNVIRVGLRDINRILRSYFMPEEGLLSGLSLSSEKVHLTPEYQTILRFYGFDMAAFNTPIFTNFPPTPQSNVTTMKVETKTENVDVTTEAIDFHTSTLSETTTESTIPPTETESTTFPTTEDTTPVSTTITTQLEDRVGVEEENTEVVTEGEMMTMDVTTEITTGFETETPTTEATTPDASQTETTIINVDTETASDVTITELITEIITETVMTEAMDTVTRMEEITELVTIDETATPETMTMEITEFITTDYTEDPNMAFTVENPKTEIPETTIQPPSETTVAPKASDVTEKNDELSLNDPPTVIEPTIIGPPTIIEPTITGPRKPEPPLQQIERAVDSLGKIKSAVTGQEPKRNVTAPIPKKRRSLKDYIFAKYYGDPSLNPHYEEPNDKYSFLVNSRFRETDINFITYDAVFPFVCIHSLDAFALKFPLDEPKYYLLLILPANPFGIERLILDLNNNVDLKHIVAEMRPKYVRAVIPNFMLRGFVSLTSSLQKMGIRQIFDPRLADLSVMTNDNNIYVTNIEQAITVTIKNYMTMKNTKTDYANQYAQAEFKATHPFLYFVMDTELDVALVAGKIIDPVNSRIQ